MNHTEFMDLHADCVALMRSYFVEAEKFTAMLADCTAKPLSLKKRLQLTAQGIAEHEAQLTYLSCKGLLLNTARLGYGFCN